MPRLATLAALAVAAISATQPGRAGAQATPVAIDWNDVRQSIDGFGVAQTAADPSDTAPGAYDLASLLRGFVGVHQILDLTFSRTAGIGLTIFRSKIRPSLSPSPGVWNYSDPDQVWLMKQAVARGPVKLIGSVWSPPAWMKTDGRTSSGTCYGSGVACRANTDCGCTASDPKPENCGSLVCQEGTSYLKTANYQDYATYLARYAVQYASTNGVQIYAVSLANEPDTSQLWDSCAWTGAQLATFLGSYLAPTFANLGVTAKVIALETANWANANARLAPAFNSQPARDRLDIAGSHVYDDNDGTAPADYIHGAATYGKRTWVTETSLRFPAWDIEGALRWAQSIHRALVVGRANAWLWWNLALWDDDQSLIALDVPAGTFRVSKTFWVLGNFSKFVRPGFVRIGVGATPAGVDVSAYRDPNTDQFVVVAINRNTSSKQLALNVQGFWTHEVTPWRTSATHDLVALAPTYLMHPQTIPASSVVSYVSRTRNFTIWAAAPGARPVVGDFNADGKDDIALVSGSGWTTIPVALSTGGGSFSVVNFPAPDLAAITQAPGAQVVAGDFNQDGRDDLAVLGAAGWTTVPIAMSNGNGSFSLSNLSDATLPVWAQAPGAKLLAGDVNFDGTDDLVLVGGSGWSAIRIGYSNGNGTFASSSVTSPTFAVWAQDPYADAAMADVNGDGRADIILTGGDSWTTVPIAISVVGGTFTIVNQPNASLAGWSQAPEAQLLAGCRRSRPHPSRPLAARCDVNNDATYRADLLLTGGPGWTTIPLGLSLGNGTFTTANPGVYEFPTWAQDPAVTAVSGDFDGDRRADIALLGGAQWWTVPIAHSTGSGTFTTTNNPIN